MPVPVVISPEMITLLTTIYNYGKVLIWFAAGAIASWKVVQWVKEIRTKDFKEVRDSVSNAQKSIEAVSVSIEALGHKLDTQTQAVVGELKELRSDFRTFYTQPVPQMLPAQSKQKRVLKPKAVRAA